MLKAVGALLLAGTVLNGTVHGQTPADEDVWWSVIDSLPPGVTVMEVDSIYGFEADNPEAISLYLKVLGPRSNGEDFHGLHRSEWRSRYIFERNAEGECRPADLRILLRSVIVMPHLINAASVDDELREQWMAYLAALRQHEEGHREILREALVSLRLQLLASPYRPCSEYPAAFQPIKDANREELLRIQAAYDSETQHGRGKGAVWPPGGDI